MFNHGDARNQQVSYRQCPVIGTTPGGGVVRIVDHPGAVVSSCERWCSVCDNWYRAEGIVGELKFHLEHDVSHGISRPAPRIAGCE